MTVKEAAEILECSPQFIRVGLQKGVFPWGYAVNGGKRWRYCINREKFLEIEKGESNGKD